MLAKQLAHILNELCGKSDLSTDALADMDQRFEALRGSGRLPSGRESRGQKLSDEQIVAGVLGLVAGRPSWAGMVCASIAHLKPVGGKADAFGGAATLTDALSNLLADKAMRDSIIGVRLSAAEAGTNSHGLAVITYERDGARHQLSFVRDEAVSLLQPGVSFDAELRNAPVSRELVFNRRFFEQLARRIEDARAHPSPPIGDGSEYDKEDAENARRQRLGVTSSSHFLNIGVDNQVTWPREEMLVNFDRYKFVLMPKTKEHVQSIHVDLHANKLSMEEAMTVINRFLSLLTWCDDQFAIAQDGWSGNPVPVAVPKRNLAFTTTHYWVFDRDIPASEEAQRALALYREARNAEQNFMISYAVLSYFKVLEVRYPEGKDIRPWVARTFPLIRAEEDESNLRPFLAACGSETVEDYLWKACRVAVAHVREKHPSDPDIAEELTRLHHAADIMRLFARYFIRHELGVSDSPFREVERD
ncbi:hypothetical protein DLM45_13235 [Hyphomicrobium methylovorum]|uniref:methylamine utilization protein MauJ n=1 Tax=Hyphomicrobium methylovorum TaxID=84 RepID=UPI0015E7756B|nr:methylamine utilization protein MauJ [Hyphomicrobium methylovorum]MBA2127177.1 hypothetical protein [Hyphomicrobium methylovorum]